jgi:hypothetical protein
MLGALSAMASAMTDKTESLASGSNPADLYAPIINSLSAYAGEYVFYDIDGNGIAELIISYEKQMDNFTEIYSYVDDNICEIGKYWSRSYLAAIDDEGVIYRISFNGAEETTIEASRLSDEKTHLEIIDYCTSDYDANVFTYYSDGVEQRISEEDFNDIFNALNDNDSVLSSFEWIPLPISRGGNLSKSDWTSVRGEIKIPPAWTYDILTEDDTMEWINISGEGANSRIDMQVGYIIAGDLESTFESSLSHQEFLFDDGRIGYMFEFPNSIAWVHADSWWNGIGLYHGGDRSVFTDNEAIITAVAATLASESDGVEKYAYVKVDEDAAYMTFIADGLLPLLIDDVIWIRWDDFELQELYGITDMDDDYALVNEDETWMSYVVDADTTIRLADFETGLHREVTLKEFMDYSLSLQKNDVFVLAKVLLSEVGDVISIDEVFRP